MSKLSRGTKMAVALGLMLSSAVAFGTPAQAARVSDGTPNKVIVVYKDSATANSKSKELKDKGKLKKQLKNINSVVANLTESEMAEVAKDPNVVAVEKDTKISYIGEKAKVGIKDYQDWGLVAIGAPASSTSGLTGNGVKIAIIDTGADLTHPDLKIAGGVSEVDYTTSYQDDQGHGTHVAGIINAQNNGIGTVGIAPGASVYAVKALDSTGAGYMSDIIAGINWAIQNRMDIISMSLGAQTSSAALQSACNSAYANGSLVVAAAGNDGSATATASQNTIDYPARYTTSVISVGAVDNSNKRASFSSSGKELEVAAPGVNITSTYLGGQYAQMSGTSMATPYVAGDIALLKQKYPTYTNVQLRALLDKSVTDLGTKGRDSFYGYGLIKAPTK